MGDLFEQLPRHKLRPKSKYFCAHQIADDKTIILSSKNVQKVDYRPKLLGFEKGVAKLVIDGCKICLYHLWEPC